MAGLIPEISFDELVPVENFFSSYVAELENLGASGVRPQAHDCATGAVQQHSTLQSLLADANEYQSMMQHAELNVDLGKGSQAS